MHGDYHLVSLWFNQKHYGGQCVVLPPHSHMVPGESLSLDSCCAEVYILSLGLYGFPLGSPVSSNLPKIPVGDYALGVNECVCMCV